MSDALNVASLCYALLNTLRTRCITVTLTVLHKRAAAAPRQTSLQAALAMVRVVGACVQVLPFFAQVLEA
jgi:hypothetical protein